MPIIGMQNSTNKVYLNSLREILEEDNRIKNQVFKQNIKKVQVLDGIIPNEGQAVQETPKPLDMALYDSTKSTVKIDIIDLLKKLEVLDGYTRELESSVFIEVNSLSNINNIALSTIESLITKISRIAETIEAYNKIISSINKSGISQNMRDSLANELRKLLPLLKNISNNLSNSVSNFLTAVDDIGSAVMSNKERQKYVEIIPKIISIQSLIQTMIKNIEDDIRTPITMEDINRNYIKILKNNHSILKNLDIIKDGMQIDNVPYIMNKIRKMEEEAGRSFSDGEKSRIIKDAGELGAKPIFDRKILDALLKYQGKLKKNSPEEETTISPEETEEEEEEDEEIPDENFDDDEFKKSTEYKIMKKKYEDIEDYIAKLKGIKEDLAEIERKIEANPRGRNIKKEKERVQADAEQYLNTNKEKIKGLFSDLDKSVLAKSESLNPKLKDNFLEFIRKEFPITPDMRELEGAGKKSAGNTKRAIMEYNPYGNNI
jgi:hypothetical protein